MVSRLILNHLLNHLPFIDQKGKQNINYPKILPTIEPRFLGQIIYQSRGVTSCERINPVDELDL